MFNICSALMLYMKAKAHLIKNICQKKINLMQLFQLKQIAFFHLLVPMEKKIGIVKKQFLQFFIDNTVVITCQWPH